MTRLHGAGEQDSETFIDLLDADAPTERRRRIRGDWRRLLDLRFAPDGRTLATASNDCPPGVEPDLAPDKDRRGSTRLWDVATGRERLRLAVEGAFVGSVNFAPDGRWLAAGASDQTIRFHDPATGREVFPRLDLERASPPGPERPHPDWGDLATRDLVGATCQAIATGGKTIATGSGGSGSSGDAWVAGVYLWDIDAGRVVRRIPAHLGWIHSVSFAPDGRTLATTGAETVVRLWDAASGRELVPQSGHCSSINIVAVSAADGTVFTAGQDGTVRIWDLSTGRERGVFARFSAPISSMVIDADGQTLLTGEPFGAVTLWDVLGRREIRRFAPNGARRGVRRVAFSPDHRRVLAAGPKWVRIWDLATGDEVRGETWPVAVAEGEVISPDGRFAAACGQGPRPGREGNDPTIRVRERPSGREVATLGGPEEGTAAMAFSPDGRRLAASSGTIHDGPASTVTIWDLVGGRRLRQLEGHRSAINAMAFAPDGRSLVTGAEDGTALIWDVSDLRDAPRPDAAGAALDRLPR